MCNNSKTVSLGFTEERVPAGTHMCLIFTDDNERRDSLLQFLLSGLREGERAACFSEKVTEEMIRAYLSENEISYDERKTDNAISCSSTSEVYFHDGIFDPDRMLNTLSDFYQQTQDLGFTGARVIGEMTPEVEHVPGGDRLLEYESRVSLMVREKPVTAVCQYDANQFSGAAIMNILKVHPKMIVNGIVVHNPFFIEPEQFLKLGT
jgi:hypothetical protein